MDRRIQELLKLLDNSVDLKDGHIVILDSSKLRANISKFAELSALGSGYQQGLARYLTRKIALALDIIPSSINDLYLARGRGEVPTNFTVPAINLRALSFNAACTVFKVANSMDAGAFIFEIARSEMGYTDQRPSEYVTSILAAAIKEDFRGAIFIQGDHFQVSPKRFIENKDKEIQAIKDLSIEAISAGFYNIDIDTSTLVDLSKTTIPEQQRLNTSLSAEFSAFIRSIQPKDIPVSIGGEIGEVGGHNSTEEELRVYMDGYNSHLKEISPKAIGLSKISIQTGTSHGGVVLPDGSIAKVKVDFDTLLKLSRIARKDYGMGGAVQHGASTLPEDAFGKFVESEAVEVHLATNFQNIFYDLIPDDLRNDIYAYLRENHSNERKEGQTDDQFYYKTRKRAIGPFKKQTWSLPPEQKEKIEAAWESKFRNLFTLLKIHGTKKYVGKHIKHVKIQPKLENYLKDVLSAEDTSDLAD
ncbi:MAG TPA: aldolase [Anaerolineae bacterium]|nr:aldolase [Anaerolineae bacterium]